MPSRDDMRVLGRSGRGRDRIVVGHAFHPVVADHVTRVERKRARRVVAGPSGHDRDRRRGSEAFEGRDRVRRSDGVSGRAHDRRERAVVVERVQRRARRERSSATLPSGEKREIAAKSVRPRPCASGCARRRVVMLGDARANALAPVARSRRRSAMRAAQR